MNQETISNSQRLTNLHDSVKGHIYRYTGDKWERYRELLLAMRDAFWASVKEKNDDVLRRAAFNVYHDFTASIIAIEGENYSQERKNESALMVEKTIGYIHRYIEEGHLNQYELYYGGRNYLKAFGRWRTYRLRGDRYEAVYTKKQVNAAIKEIEEKREELLNKGIEPIERGTYSKGYLDYLKNYKPFRKGR